jgi:hypothetical protein
MNPDHDDIQDQKLEHILRTIDKTTESRMVDPTAQAFETALRRVIADDEVVTSFWARGYKELENHATNGASQWIGRRILTAIVVAGVTAGLVWLIKTGALK